MAKMVAFNSRNVGSDPHFGYDYRHWGFRVHSDHHNGYLDVSFLVECGSSCGRCGFDRHRRQGRNENRGWIGWFITFGVPVLLKFEHALCRFKR